MITVYYEVYHYFNIRVDGWVAFGTVLLITLVTWEAQRLLQSPLQRMSSLQKHKVKFLILFFAIGAIIANTAAVLLIFFIGRYGYSYTSDELYNPIKLNLIYASLVNLGLHLINTIFFYFEEYKKQWMEAEELRRLTAQAQVQLLQSQIKPHFLFNNLNVLAGMVSKDNPEANRFIEEFSKVYRYILKNHDKELVELRQELDFIESYIYLLKKRFNDGVYISINVPLYYHGHYIVPAALQMLIENAVKHNVASPGRPLKVAVQTNGDGLLRVCNNLQLRTDATVSHHMGLQNIQKRYESISDRKMEVCQTENTFEVSLPLLILHLYD